MSPIMFSEMWKWIAGGGSVGAVLLCIGAYWYHSRIKKNEKDIRLNAIADTKRDDRLVVHDIILTRIEANQKSAMAGQRDMSKKLDMIVEKLIP